MWVWHTHLQLPLLGPCDWHCPTHGFAHPTFETVDESSLFLFWGTVSRFPERPHHFTVGGLSAPLLTQRFLEGFCLLWVAVLLVSEAGCHVAQTGLELPLSPRRTLGFWFSCPVLGLQDHAFIFSLCSAGTGPKTSRYIPSPRDVFFYWNRVSLCRPHGPQTHISRGRIMCMSNLNAADILSTHWQSETQCGFGYVHRDVQLWPWPHSIMISPSQMETLCPWGNHFPFLFPTSSQLPPVYFIICLFWEFDRNVRIFQKYRNSLYVYVYICTCVGVHVYLYICGNVTGICEWVYMCKCVYVFV